MNTSIINQNEGIIFEYIFPAIIFSFASIIGISLNFSVCYISFKYRKQYSTLSSNTAFLLSINSFFEILHQTGNFFHLLITATGIHFIQFKFAILFQIQSFIGYYTSVLMFTILKEYLKLF
ncbi:G_PROTEIN_RECEP_F1_2 domain-containing protein [Meloidogyne graminicola]|uniref:G_PROTEIN_RECEP_F1_2 domain-containing protein n=1 Tax=Meloidogyne graminicola TaxID=189291 RepID=A0A8S9ZJL1_9BILA|nr:G_PROTEIN_RECEP_F1_2 domain-containing protein [Meloidogyne graminicola]